MPEYVRPQTEAELNRQLADTIGESVLQLMGGAGWTEANNMLIDPKGQGQPSPVGDASTVSPEAAKPVGTTPAPAAASASPASPAAPADPFAEFRDANGKYIGKYDDANQFVRGIGHAMKMTKDTMTENELLRKQVADLQSQSRPAPVAPQVTAPQAPSPSAPTREDATPVSPKLAEALANYQESPDAEGMIKLTTAISEHVSEVARAAAREETEARDKVARATADRWEKVDDYMKGSFPNSMNFTTEMHLFQTANPQVGAMVTALIKENLHEKAMEYCWKEYAATVGLDPKAGAAPKPFVPAPATKDNVVKEIVLDEADKVRREAREKALKDAGVLGAGDGGLKGVHETVPSATQAEMDEAAALLRQGDGTKWRAITFRDQLNHPIFG